MNTPYNWTVKREKWPIAGNFVISRGAKTEAEVIVVAVNDGQFTGRGECVPYGRYGETVKSVAAQIEDQINRADHFSRRQLIEELPAGAARNALDCALWDLEAKQNSIPAWKLAGLSSIDPAVTAFTISLGSPEKMAQDCQSAIKRTVLKVKLGGDGDDARMIAIRKAAPHAKIILDANEAWDENNFEKFMRIAYEIDASLIEQPLPAGEDAILEKAKRLVPVCADESLHTRKELGSLRKRYDCINIKLDKAGGLSEALALKEAAIEQGFMIMVGCMVSTSLSMAPAMLVAQGAEFVDLDGPLLLANDRKPSIRYDGSTIFPPEKELWG